MDIAAKIALVIAFIDAALLSMLSGGGLATGKMMGGGMSGHGAMAGIGWMWIPTVLMVGLGSLLVWAIFRKK